MHLENEIILIGLNSTQFFSLLSYGNVGLQSFMKWHGTE